MSKKIIITIILVLFLLFGLVTLIGLLGLYKYIKSPNYVDLDDTTSHECLNIDPTPVDIPDPFEKSNAIFTVNRPEYNENMPELKWTFEEYPKVDSSTSNQHIIYKSFCEITGYSCQEDEFEGEKWISLDYQDLDKIGTQKFEDKIKTSKTHNSYLNLIDGTVDLILVASLPSEEEQEYAKQSGVQVELTPIAKDAFIFLKHKENPVESLSLTNLKEIYSGKISNWEDLCSKENKINAYVRNPNSGSQETMKLLIMQGAELIEMEEMIKPSMIGLINKLDSDPNGLGYSFFYYKNAMTYADNVELLKINNILPTKDTISAEKYELTTYVYIVMRKDNENEQANILKNWLLSPHGQEVIDEVGYVRYFK
ncbi:hypothetical protein GF362_03295 [Candidatus Dojkabacteria bacterium]|nr:hypothetical protein [Candidatus Dojkabacteria bacterium]